MKYKDSMYFYTLNPLFIIANSYVFIKNCRFQRFCASGNRISA